MPDMYFDVDVAISECPVNVFPLTDDTDMKTREESVVYNQAGMDLVFNFVTSAGAFTQTAVTPTTAGVYDWTNQGNGMYTIEIPASGGGSINNDTEGYGWFTGFATGILPWRGPTIGFRSAIINDALMDSDTLMTQADLGILYISTIATVNSQTSFDMTDAIAHDDIWIGQTAVIEDVSTGMTKVVYILDVDAANNRFIMSGQAPFTAVAGDKVRVYGYQHPTWYLSNFDVVKNSELQSALASGVDVTFVNGIQIGGSGTALDPWGPA
jgi:hypothetical protein